jgi:hypothetical protein
VVVALAVHPWAGVILAAVGLVAVMMLLLMRPGMAAAADDRRPQIAASLPDEWRPQKWNIESVAARLAEAVEAVQRSAAADHAALFARTRADGIDDQPARSALEQRRQLFTDAVGVEIGDGYALADFVARLDLLAKTEAESAARHQMLSTAQEHLDRLRGEREEAIGALGAPVETGAAAQQWAAALRQLIDAENAHAANERARDQATAAAEDTQRQLTDFFTRFNWPAEGDPQTARDGFDRWFELTSQLNDAEAAASRSRDDVQRLQEAIDTTRQQVRELLDRYRFPTEADPMDAVTSFLDWFTHTATLDTARDTTRQARRRLLQRLRNSGIPADQPLRQRVQIPAARQAAADDWRRLDRQKQTRLEQASAFRDTPGCHEVFQRRDLPTNPTATQLAAARERLQPLAASAEQLQRDIAGTETRLAEELKANDLHAAHTALATAVSDIDRWLAHTLLNKAKGAVIQWSTEAHRREARPGLIERANEWLGRFSNGRYGRLDVNGSVHVIDQLEASTQKRVDQLSTGTRAHLALAVRLAVIEESETSVRFPLLLDEVLAASDPDASDAIAKAIKQIAAERQVVVFTNQPDDVNLLREVFGPDLREKMLAATGPVAQAPPAAALQRANDVDDDPEGKLPIHTPLELWPPRLIAPLIPQLGASASNVRRAMEQLEPDARSRAALLIDTLEALRHEAAAAHRIIHWSDIEQQDWTEGAYREQIYQALVDSRGHSKTLLEKFCAIAGMRRDKKSACEKWLSDNGYLVDPLPLETLVKLAWARLPEDYPNRGLVAQGLAAVFAAFVSST